MQNVTKILLVQLGANGDCLFATTIAKQIKEVDYPNCHLTWLIGSKYKHVVQNNPFIDELIEIPIDNTESLSKERFRISETLKIMNADLIYDFVFITDYYDLNKSNWYGTTRSSIFRNYPHEIKVKIESIIFLSDEEKENVRKFCSENEINANTFNILIEASPLSGQSSMNLQKAIELSRIISEINPQIKFIISSASKIQTDNISTVDASCLTWRENAELANYCDMVLGCSSGISWLCLSNWTKDINLVQVINPDYFKGQISASVKHDLMYHGLSTERILELYNPTNEYLINCILSMYEKGIKYTKEKFDSNNYYTFINKSFLKQSKIKYTKKIEIKIITFPYWFFKGINKIKRYTQHNSL